jgi:hypothetical protein
MRKQRLLMVLSLALSSMMTAGLNAAPAYASHHVDLWIGPPAAVRSSSAHTDKAKLTNDWHRSVLSGDTVTNPCSPQADGQCTALDWNDGSGANGDPVYFRAWGYGDAGSVDGRASASLTAGTAGCGSATVRWVKLYIKNLGGSTVGIMVYQHIDRSATSFYIQNGGGVYTNKLIGYQRSDSAAGSSCWTGYHVHEDDYKDGAFYAWNTNLRQGTSYEVDNSNNWTRKIRFFYGCHQCL